MAAIAFSTGRKSKVPGHPLRARACRCRRAWFDGCNCCRCGYHTAAQVDETWAKQAARMAARAQPENSPGRGLKRVAT